MKDYDQIDFADSSATEVELDAQDLLGLAPLPIAMEPAVPPQAVVEPRIEKAKPIAASAAKQGAPLMRRIALPHAAWAVGLVFVVLVSIGATNSFSPPQPQRHAAAPRSTIPERPDPVLESDEPPVLVKNPFDDSEVFELPAGTNESDAREMVADLLLKRAAERQASLNTRTAARR